MSDDSDKNNNVRSTTPAYDFANNDIITFIVDKVISQDYLDVTLENNVKANMITFISGSNAILNKWKEASVTENDNTIQAILQLSSMIIDHLTENKSSFQNNPTTFSTNIQSVFDNIEITYSTTSVYSLKLPEQRTAPWTDGEIQTMKDAIAFITDDNYAKQQVGIALFGRIEDWDISQMTNLEQLFRNVKNIPSGISGWDITNVTSLRSCFNACTNMVVDLSSWDTSNVEDMVGTFSNTTFTSDPGINNWDTSNVTSMSSMFRSSNFNYDIYKWDTSSVIGMSRMFNSHNNSIFFNKPINSSVQTKSDGTKYIAWNVSNVLTMAEMFESEHEHPFNQPLDKWDTSSVTDMNQMFFNCNKFNQRIGQNTVDFTSDGLGTYTAWNTQNVITMSRMFRNCTNFNNGSILRDATTGNPTLDTDGNEQPSTIPTKFYLNVSNVVGRGNENSDPNYSSYFPGFYQMFYNCTHFNSIIYDWPIRGSENIPDSTDNHFFDDMFRGATSFAQEIRPLNIMGTARVNMFTSATAFLAKYSSQLGFGSGSYPADLYFKFYDGDSEGEDITIWDHDTQQYQTNTYTYNANPKYQPPASFTTSNASNNKAALKEALELIGTSDEKYITDAFGALNTWDVSGVTDFEQLFRNESNIPSGISDWNVSNVTSLRSCFNACSNMVVDLSSWDTSSVEDMIGTFSNTTFTSDPGINNWDTSNVTSMSSMFRSSNFNYDIYKWDTSSVIGMSRMFNSHNNSIFFNKPINSSVQTKSDGTKYIAWNVSNVLTMAEMFESEHEHPFNQPLDKWDTSSVTDMNQMFFNCNKFNQRIGQNTVDFTSDGLGTYTAWNTQNVITMSRMFRNCTNFNNGSILRDATTGNPTLDTDGNEQPSTIPTKFYLNVSNVVGRGNENSDPNYSSYFPGFYQMFYNCTHFNSIIYDWPIRGSENIPDSTDNHFFDEMFRGATSFEQEIRNWNASYVERTNMLNGATAFLAKYVLADATPNNLFFTSFFGIDESIEIREHPPIISESTGLVTNTYQYPANPKYVGIVDLTVDGGSFSSPYYNITDISGDTVVTVDTLNINKVYRFTGGSSTHPFYISDNGYKRESSGNIALYGDGSYNFGIEGNSQSFLLRFSGLTTSDTLTYYCTKHSSMQFTFTLEDT